MKRFMFLLIAIPVLEITLLVLSGSVIGVWPTVGLIIATGVIGAWLAKREGTETIRQAKRELMYGRIPSEAVLDGICILFGGVVLLTPGFITDLLGFILLIPFTRRWIKPFLGRWLKSLFETRTFFYMKR
ncbi:UPF0716 protein FxsA [Anoxybacillus vitaminiphilus]|uniref:UPF0716 protein FxsA n=1 Tax=Paranoxybacillus vitaminiphilus TaxID=581036 RepID=A0A327YLH3_9BACL|nr:FxsA family protein [Anoxybacillus vitaminiphilus]RAK21262.1 UPF0716 protein FxsA [Anoxybacillus vitaminiphilus]